MLWRLEHALLGISEIGADFRRRLPVLAVCVFESNYDDGKLGRDNYHFDFTNWFRRSGKFFISSLAWLVLGRFRLESVVI